MSCGRCDFFIKGNIISPQSRSLVYFHNTPLAVRSGEAFIWLIVPFLEYFFKVAPWEALERPHRSRRSRRHSPVSCRNTHPLHASSTTARSGITGVGVHLSLPRHSHAVRNVGTTKVFLAPNGNPRNIGPPAPNRPTSVPWLFMFLSKTFDG